MRLGAVQRVVSLCGCRCCEPAISGDLGLLRPVPARKIRRRRQQELAAAALLLAEPCVGALGVHMCYLLVVCVRLVEIWATAA